MKTLSRNKRTIYYRNPISSAAETDTYGNETGCYTTTFSEWIEIQANYNSGSSSINLKDVGISTEANRQIVFENGKCPLTAFSQLYIGSETPTASTNPNYYVSGIIDSVNIALVTIKEVDVS